MIFLILVPATVLTVFWLALLTMVTSEDWVTAAYAQVVDNRFEIERLRRLDDEKAAQLSKYHGVMAKVMGIFLKGDSSKKIGKLSKVNGDLQNGRLKSLNVFEMPGYVLLRKVDIPSRSIWTPAPSLTGERMTIISFWPLTRSIYTARRNTESIWNCLNLLTDGPDES